MVRRASSFNTQRIDHLYRDPHEEDVRMLLHYGDLTDASQLARLIRTVEPHEIYNLAAQSHVKVSFDQAEYTGDVTGLGVTRLLEAIRDTGVETRFYQASSSEMFGSSPPPQNEETVLQLRSPYAAAKLYGHWITRNYLLPDLHLSADKGAGEGLPGRFRRLRVRSAADLLFDRRDAAGDA